MLNFPNSTIKPVDKIIKFALIFRGSILYNNKDNFYFSFPEVIYYDNENDKLVFYLEFFFLHEEYNAVKLVNNFELIIDHSNFIVGGILNQALQFLDIDSNSRKIFGDLLNQAIIMMDDTNIEKMEDKDENLEIKLRDLYSRSKNNRVFFTFFQNLLNEYYQYI